MRLALIANGNANGQRAACRLVTVEDLCNNCGLQTDIFNTRYHGHAQSIIQKLPVHEFDGIISVGGDGTNYQVINALLDFHGDSQLPPLGIIPLGRGNSFARDLDIFTIEDAIRKICRQQTKPVDVCRFSQGNMHHYFVNLMGFGFVTDVAATAAKFPMLGDASYIAGVLYRTLFLSFHHLVMTIDGQRYEEENCLVECCNSRYTGGTMLIAPEARIDDGYFDVVIVSPLSRLSLLATFPSIYRGSHGKNAAVRFIKAKRAVIETVPTKGLLPDGEHFGSTPTIVEIMPARLTYFR